MSRGEQEPKKNRDDKKTPQTEGKKPSGRELDESELDGIAGGGESEVKAPKESTEKNGLT